MYCLSSIYYLSTIYYVSSIIYIPSIYLTITYHLLSIIYLSSIIYHLSTIYYLLCIYYLSTIYLSVIYCLSSICTHLHLFKCKETVLAHGQIHDARSSLTWLLFLSTLPYCLPFSEFWEAHWQHFQIGQMKNNNIQKKAVVGWEQSSQGQTACAHSPAVPCAGSATLGRLLHLPRPTSSCIKWS